MSDIEGVKDRMIKAGHAGNIVSYCESLEQENEKLRELLKEFIFRLDGEFVYSRLIQRAKDALGE